MLVKPDGYLDPIGSTLQVDSPDPPFEAKPHAECPVTVSLSHCLLTLPYPLRPR